MQPDGLMRNLLELIAASGGIAEARIRIQKEAYLLGAKGIEGFSTRGFEYHHYGPFNRVLSSGLHSAVNAGLINEKCEDFENGTMRYRYQLTQKGEEWISRNSPRFQEISEAVAKMNAKHWRALELAATALFLERHHKFEARDIAIEEAMRRKPETRFYEGQARQVLSELQL